MIVQQLFPHLRPEYTAEPRVHLGSYYEIDVCAYEEESRNGSGGQPVRNSGLATWSPPQPTLVLDVDPKVAANSSNVLG